MRQQLLDLYEIQKIDLGIREFEVARQAAEEHLNNYREEIAGIRGELLPLAEQRTALDKEIRQLESVVRAESDKIKKWEARLKDIRNHREYLALSRETEGSRRANRDTEERILDLMTQRDDLDTTLNQMEDGLAEKEVDTDSEGVRVAERIQELEAKIISETSRRDKLTGTVKPQLLRKYDAIRKKRIGVGLIVVEAGSCQGCNMQLPPQLYNILQRANSLEQCPSCQRLMIFSGLIAQADPESADASAEEAASAEKTATEAQA